MSSLKDKLARLTGATSSSAGVTDISDSWTSSLRRDLNLHVFREKDSFILYKEELIAVENDKAFLLLQNQGFETHSFGDLLGFSQAHSINLRHTVFFDLETTGLAGGTGTYAFLVGVGTIESHAIRIRQYLLPDFNHEWLMLQNLSRLFGKFAFTGTFNGKTFDVPLLGNRFVLNRMENVLENMEHIDILHAARRIWGKLLPACNLQTLEKYILGQERSDDIPGSLIPHIYFEFIRNRKLWMMADVLEHNRQDIQNMILLTLRLAAISEQPHQFIASPEELLMLAEYYYRQKHFYKVQNLLLPVLAAPTKVTPAVQRRMHYLMAMALKRSGNRQDATRHLWTIVKEQQFSPEAIIELAKYYEHVEKDYAKALEIVRQGVKQITILDQLGRWRDMPRFVKELHHRQDRLEQKLRKRKANDRKIN